jgi:hypothetical protein
VSERLAGQAFLADELHPPSAEAGFGIARRWNDEPETWVEKRASMALKLIRLRRAT